MNLLDKVLSLIYPCRCVLCGSVYGNKGLIHICGGCLDKISFLDERKICKKCSRPIGEDSVFCVNCRINPHFYFIHISCALFEGKMRQSILHYKFYRYTHHHITFANMILHRLLNYGNLPKPDFVIAVPLHRDRIRDRGYHHTRLIAARVAKGLGCPHEKKMVLKIKNTAPQSKTPRHKRRENIKDSFAVKNKKMAAGKTILIIDDVYTSGSTIDEISKVLLAAGAKQVFAATVAITPD